MKNLIITVLVVIAAFSMIGCVASTLPLTSNVNESIMMGIKTSKIKSVSYEYQSNVADGIIKPCAKDTRDIQSSHPGYSHNESTVLDKMIRDYCSMKFGSIEDTANIKIKVSLKDFWLEQYSPDSTGKKFLAVLGGGELNVVVTANLQLVYELSIDGNEPTRKIVKVVGDSTHVTGIGTGTSTSNLHRGRDSIEFRAAEAINAANSKALVMLNQLLESNEI